MATFLYKLGRFSFRQRRYVLLLWVALLALAGVGAAPSAPSDMGVGVGIASITALATTLGL